tara:strand:- start:910 stop:1287 length:378 start_codon:yes stop_codon:yes gene_type:complete
MSISVSLLITALAIVESNMDPNAIGDDGEAVGILQITPIVIRDVNRIFGTDYTLEDRKNVQFSRNICNLYLSYYGDKYEEDTGFKKSPEALARIWNGGPYGYNKKYTKAYWLKVKKVIDYQKGEK